MTRKYFYGDLAALNDMWSEDTPEADSDQEEDNGITVDDSSDEEDNILLAKSLWNLFTFFLHLT